MDDEKLDAGPNTRWERFAYPPSRLVFNGWWTWLPFVLGISFYWLGAAVHGFWKPGIPWNFLFDSSVAFIWPLILQVFTRKRDYRDW